MLYGWGAREEDDEGEDEYEVEDRDLDDEDEDEEAITTSASRVTLQSRSDFYLIDEAALTKHVQQRVAELGRNWSQESLSELGAFGAFAELWSIDNVDLAGTGLARAGSQSTTHEIEQTLWEMDEVDYELREDAFPIGD